MLLSELRSKGLSITAQDDKLYVEPASVLTDSLRESIRRNKPAILRELTSEAADRRGAILKAVAASPIGEFSNALRAGTLHVCCNCANFTFADDPAALGLCTHFAEALHPFMPFECSAFTRAREPVAPKCLPEVSE